MTDEIDSKQKKLDEKESMIETLQKKLKDKENASALPNKVEEKECNICYEPLNSDRRPMCFLHCGHTRTCQDCYHQLQGNKKLCPECRFEIKQACFFIDVIVYNTFQIVTYTAENLLITVCNHSRLITHKVINK